MDAPLVTDVLLLLVVGVLVGLIVIVLRRRNETEVAHQQQAAALTQLRAQADAQAEDIRSAADKYSQLTRSHADTVLREAERDRSDMEAARAELERARAEVERLRTDTEERLRTERAELREVRRSQQRHDQRLTEREDRLDGEARILDERIASLRARRTEVDDREQRLTVRESELDGELERIGGLTADQAKAEVVASIEAEAKRRGVIIARDIEADAHKQGEARAQRIIVGAIQRLAAEQTAESVVSTVDLPGDEMKGRIIGREGRNIRAFEQVTGVNVMIDDTPGSVLLSCFDPVRRETARVTLTELVADGRIHPARIEEVHLRATNKVGERCVRAAEDALNDIGIHDLHPDLIPVLGSLRYRTSYGQNVLKHLVECGHIAGMMAGELGLDVAHCKRAAFLHDIGKALTHEVEGTHAIVGANLARKYGEHSDVVHAIEAHHNEVEPRTVEAILTQAADAISGGRPGARRETLESYVRRLERLEEIASSHDGVDKVFAMQAGREIRVMVAPDRVDDVEAQVMAREIVKQVEEELTYPGQIRVTVVRESRATELAR